MLYTFHPGKTKHHSTVNTLLSLSFLALPLPRFSTPPSSPQAIHTDPTALPKHPVNC
ncbi:hypothetical protein E2C01_082869 [Portunus trituberculatus]|uniref:Uncharacterized protein n=1 Tax=Portunus trituberculatus TaxID=210409 RepID=A0A5B7IR08_PORTR|nr:hypothetical protein [Portunus trituberculatus]